MAIFKVIVRDVTCTVPLGLMVTNVSESGFLVSWDQSDIAITYDVEILTIVGDIGSAPLTIDTDIITLDNTNITIDATQTDIVRTVNNQLQVSELTPGIEYGVRIRSVCGLDSVSSFTTVITVMTVDVFDFRASNAVIRVSNTNLRISELQISNSEI